MKSLIAVLALTCAAMTAHAAPAVTNKSTALQAQGRTDAATVATLPEKTKVNVLRAAGAWREVKAATGQTGWIYMFDLDAEKTESGAAASTSGSANPISALGNLLSGGRSSNDATVGTAVKGFTKEDLQNAQANPGELQKLQSYSVKKAGGQSFAQKSKLTATTVEYLPEPAPVRTESTSLGG
jgi:SH3-like domain-containing protein